MATEQLPRISVIEPVGEALGKVNAILFRPFNIGKWFTIGFCAWLAYLGKGGAGFNFPGRYGRPCSSGGEPFYQVKEVRLPLLALQRERLQQDHLYLCQIHVQLQRPAGWGIDKLPVPQPKSAITKSFTAPAFSTTHSSVF